MVSKNGLFLFRSVLISIPLVLFLSFVLCLSVIVINGWRRKDLEDIKRITFHHYKLTQFNPTSDETSHGIVTFPYQIEDGFISYSDNENLFLISNIDDLEFKCTVTCFCEEQIERRYSSAVKRSFTVLVAALSSSLAIQVAKERFTDGEICRDYSLIDKNGEKCSEHAVRSSVEECEIIIDESMEFGMDKEGIMHRKFECRGSCMQYKYYDGENIYLDSEPYGHNLKLSPEEKQQFELLQKMVDETECTKYKLFSEVLIDYSPDMLSQIKRMYEGEDGLKKGYKNVANVQFMAKFLHPYCMKESGRKAYSTPEMEEAIKDYDRLHYGSETSFPMCCGWHGNHGFNPTVFCFEKDFEEMKE